MSETRWRAYWRARNDALVQYDGATPSTRTVIIEMFVPESVEGLPVSERLLGWLDLLAPDGVLPEPVDYPAEIARLQAKNAALTEALRAARPVVVGESCRHDDPPVDCCDCPAIVRQIDAALGEPDACATGSSSWSARQRSVGSG